MNYELRVTWAVESVAHDGFSIASAAARYAVTDEAVQARIAQDELDAEDGTQSSQY